MVSIHLVRKLYALISLAFEQVRTSAEREDDATEGRTVTI